MEWAGVDIYQQDMGGGCKRSVSRISQKEKQRVLNGKTNSGAYSSTAAFKKKYIYLYRRFICLKQKEKFFK